MFTVAIIGPDGAGKTTLCRRLERSLPVPAKHIYLGVSRESSNYMLPTTWLLWALRRAMGKRAASGPPDASSATGALACAPGRLARPEQKFAGLKRVLVSMKRVVGLVLRVSEEWFRQAVAWWYLGRGCVVLFDRHFFLDYYAHDVAGDRRGRPLCRRIHGWLLQRFYPRPDLVIYLDAPASVLFQRKGEGTVESLERMRQEYQQLRDVVPCFVTIDANAPLQSVLRGVMQTILDFGAASAGVEVRDATVR